MVKTYSVDSLHLKDFSKLIMENKKKYLINCIRYYEKKHDTDRAIKYKKQLKKLEQLLSIN